MEARDENFLAGPVNIDRGKGSAGRLTVEERTGKAEDSRRVLQEWESRGAGSCWFLYSVCGARPARGFGHLSGRQVDAQKLNSVKDN